MKTTIETSEGTWTIEKRIWKHAPLRGKFDWRGVERFVLLDGDGDVYYHYGTEEEAIEAARMI